MSAARSILFAALDALTDSDPERAHGQAEEALLTYLRDQGHADVADAYERTRDRIGFWYA